MTKEYSMEFTKEDTLLDRIAELEKENKQIQTLQERIEQLEKENEELKKESEFYYGERCNYKVAFLKEVNEKNKTLTQAKSLLRELYSIIKVECSPFTREEHKNILSEAEEFLTKEVEIYD